MKLGQIDAICIDEIQYAKGHKCLTLLYKRSTWASPACFGWPSNEPSNRFKVDHQRLKPAEMPVFERASGQVFFVENGARPVRAGSL